MKKVLLAILLLVNATAFGQTQLPTALGDVYYSTDLYKVQYDSPEGSPYLNPEFSPAKINNIRETKLVRFDAFEGRIEVMANSSQVIVLNPSQTFIISLLDGSDRKFETQAYIDEKGSKKNSFFELLATQENFKLYFKEKIKLFKAKKAQAYKAGEPAQFRRIKATYYITDFKNNSETLIGVPQSKKSFAEFFPKHTKEIKDLIKKKKLKISKREDLVEIFEFYFEQS